MRSNHKSDTIRGILLLGALLSCIFDLGAAEGQALRKVNVTIPALTESSIVFFVAREKGYWREKGLDVELILARAAPSIQAVIAGNVEFGTAGGSALLPITRGLPMTFLLTTFDRANFSLYVQPQLRSIRELKNKRIGISSFGSGPDSLLRDFLADNGIDGGREATILAVGSGMERFIALKTGAVDAAMLSPSAYLMAEEAGFKELVSFVKQTNYVYLQGGVIARNDLLKSDPVLVEKFIRGSLKGLLYVHQNRAPTVSILARLLKLKPEIAARIYDEIRPGLTRDGSVDTAQQKKSLAPFLARTGSKETPPLDKIFDFSTTRKVFAELQAAGWNPAP
ncbi:MAG TPA: ABC transporter substrate-binding protein [Candidatus Eisenbacteria bacterium]|nr:ABC transporter substrate-binding protein [Candidatus Eisenbacteria bacterium]